MDHRGKFSLAVSPEESGMRLDLFLCAQMPSCSRSAAAAVVRDEAVRVDGTVKKAGYRVRPGEVVTGFISEPEPVDFAPEPVDFGILYEDPHLFVVDKPAGLVVHPSPGHTGGTLVNGLLFRCPDLAASGGIGGRVRPGIVHRLDKDTSGLLLVAKNDAAHQHLAAQFKARTVEKEYLALVRGDPAEDEGTVALPIGRHPVERKKMSVRSRSPRTALTRWRVAERFPGAALLRVRILTGRTHQIRVHLSAVGLPIVGDKVYGKAPKNTAPRLRAAGRQMLHAHEIRFRHPIDNRLRCFRSPMPPDMQGLLESLAGTSGVGSRM